MADNQYVNRVDYGGNTLIDITDTTAEASDVVSGEVFYAKSGARTVGTANYAPASHAHGDITSGGDITAAAPTVASGDKLVINDESASKITNGPSFGSDTTKYLRNDGSWQVPPGTYSHPTQSAATAAAKKVGNDGLGHVVLGDALTASDVGAAASTHTHGVADVTGAVWYGTCDTAASTQKKAVTCTGFPASALAAGTFLIVKFTNAQSYNGAPTMTVNSTTNTAIKYMGTSNAVRYEWRAGETVFFVHDGTNWIILDAGRANTSYYGITKLSESITSTSNDLAASLKSVNTLATTLTGLAAYSSTGNYAIGDRVRYSTGIWQCTTAITGEGEAWNAAHWTQLSDLLTQIDGKQPQHSTATASLTVNGWSNNSQTASATGVTASNDVIVSPAPASAADWAAAGIVCTAQGAGTLTFTCTTVPTSALTANVLILG